MKWYVSSSFSWDVSCLSFSLPFNVALVAVVLARFAGGGFVPAFVDGFLACFKLFSFSLRFWASNVVIVMLLSDARRSEGLEVWVGCSFGRKGKYAPSEIVMCRADDWRISDS